MPRRTHLELVVDILSITREGASKTAIIRKANLNFERANRYISFLLSRGFIIAEKESTGRVKYVTSESGLSFLNDWEDTKRVELEFSEKFMKLQKLLNSRGD